MRKAIHITFPLLDKVLFSMKTPGFFNFMHPKLAAPTPFGPNETQQFFFLILKSRTPP